MTQTIGRGGTITLDAYYRDGAGQLVDPVSPKVSIVDAQGTTVVSLATPTTHVATGHYQYAYPVAVGAPLGAWEAVWYGTINGSPVQDEDGFTVVVAGSISTPDSSGSETGACADWITWAQVVAFGCDATVDATIQDLILSAVSNRLYDASCRQYGLCEATARPVPCCRHRRTFCSCGLYPYITLGRDPIVEITSVLIDGVALAPSAYRVDDFERLVRLDGDRWPFCNDLSVADDAAGAFTVSWTYGLAVPPEGVIAACLLACSYAHEIADTCGPPQNADQINREGVTIILNSKSKTGIKFVDDWIDSFNCGGAIFDPGHQRTLLRTDT